LRSNGFFTGIETLRTLEKKHFIALRKILGSKNQFLPELKFVFQKKDKKKRPVKFHGAFLLFFYPN
jgi:hypothetical protein